MFGRLVTAGDKARIIQDKEEQLNSLNDIKFCDGVRAIGFRVDTSETIHRVRQEPLSRLSKDNWPNFILQ